MAMHECHKERELETLDAGMTRVHKELYEGREGRQPVLVRVDRCERIVNALTYISTALLVSVLIGAGSLIFRAVTAK